jgi:YVTN family beta-propeller protein
MCQSRVGIYPDAVAFNLSNKEVYVANSGSNDVSVIDGTTNSVVSTISVGNEPSSIAIS